MTFYGDEIGERPTKLQVETYISEKGLFVNPDDVFKYWDEKGWETKKGFPVKTLETAINIVNSIAVCRHIRNTYKRVLTPYGTRHYQNGLNNIFECVSEVNYSKEKIEYSAWTDGSCDNLSSMKPGGSAYVIYKGNEIVRAKNYGCLHTSNNRMEMLAIVSATTYTPEGSKLDIYTDSQYCINVFSGKWSAKVNLDLLEKFNQAASKLERVVFHWVKGHNGDLNNEMVDDMAYSAYIDQVNKYGLQANKKLFQS